jgi:ribosomal protein S18 acetylase RimI-like enzyme
MKKQGDINFILEEIQITKQNLPKCKDLFNSVGKIYIKAFEKQNKTIIKQEEPEKYKNLIKNGETIKDLVISRWDKKLKQIYNDLPDSSLINNCYLLIAKSTNKILYGFLLFFIAPVKKILDKSLTGERIPSISQLLINNKITYQTQNEAYINLLAVSPEYQRHGLGRKLIFALLANHPKVKTLYIVTPATEANKNAKEFYKHIGFKATIRFISSENKENIVYILNKK